MTTFSIDVILFILLVYLTDPRSDTMELASFIDFYNRNSKTISDLAKNAYNKFFDLIVDVNSHYMHDTGKALRLIVDFIYDNLNIKDALYLLVLWNLAMDYHNPDWKNNKIILFVDNLDCIDEYQELTDFITCIDALTVDMSNLLDKLVLSDTEEKGESFISKIKIFIALRETTKANLPSSHYSDAFRNIYTNIDLTECYDKGEIIKHRINTIKEYDISDSLGDDQKEQFRLILDIVKDYYTKSVIYPLFNNNYRAAIEMLISIIIQHTDKMKEYTKLMNLDHSEYKHGARGILYKFIFDEFNKSYGNQSSCFKRIGVVDLLNRKNNTVSICRLILSYLSNYTETKCDSGSNGVSLGEIMTAFHDIFNEREVEKRLREMFALRDTVWTHLVSFNQIDFKKDEQVIGNNTDFADLNPEKTILHYSCAGKIYLEYVATHFEFFTARIFKNTRDALFCDSNLSRDPSTGKYICVDTINNIFNEVSKCCNSLREHNMNICDKNNYGNPYESQEAYIKSHYICVIKRLDRNGMERRFKQFHEERMLTTHINYIDIYRSYVLNNRSEISDADKISLNKDLVDAINRYVQLLASAIVLKSRYTSDELIPHYNKQIKKITGNLLDFKTVIRKDD